MLGISEKTNTNLPRADRAEDVGVDSKQILNFLKDIEEKNFEIHSFMVLRHGKVAAECFRSPFSPERPHMMYSVSKSITAAAIGLAIHEGYLSIDTKVRDIFPDYTENIVDENLDELRVHHLLSMTSGKNPNPSYDKGKIDWIDYYFKSPWYAKPGKFRYVNENIYILSVIIKRLTGQTIRDFLQPRLFEPLSIDYPFWETDNQGIEAGGWGLYLKTEDLAKFMLCYASKGKYNGKQIIPEEWVEASTAVQADNCENIDPDGCVGYGYCFWHNYGCRESYRADGMFSQFGIVFYELDAVLIVTSAIPNEQSVLNLIWEHFPKAFLADESQINEDELVPNLNELLLSSPIDIPKTSSPSVIEKRIDGKTIKIRKKYLQDFFGFPVGVLPLVITFMTTDKAGNIDNIILKFDENECTMTWSEGMETNSILCGMDGHFRYSDMKLGGIDYNVCCNAEWLNDNELKIHIRPINAVAKRMLNFKFKGKSKVIIIPSSTPLVKEILELLSAGVADFLGVSDTLAFIIGKLALRVLPKFIEPKLKGKIKTDT